MDKKYSLNLLNHLKNINFNSWVIGEIQKKDKNQNSIQILNYEKIKLSIFLLGLEVT